MIKKLARKYGAGNTSIQDMRSLLRFLFFVTITGACKYKVREKYKFIFLSFL